MRTVNRGVGLAACLLAWSIQAGAGGGGLGGATEITQIANNVQLVMQYEQTVASYIRQGLQLQNQLTNLIQNPASLLGQEIGGIINNVGRIYSGGQAIGANLARIDRNFATNFKSPTAETLARSFTRWHHTNTDTLEAALKSAGLYRDQFDSDNAALQKLYTESQSTRGNLDSLQTLAKFNAAQIQQLQGLKDLIATQSIAMNTHLATENAKAAKRQESAEAFGERNPEPIPRLKADQKAINWTEVLFK